MRRRSQLNATSSPAGNDKDDDGTPSVSGAVTLASIWEDDMITKKADDGKKLWCCRWCNKNYSTWNATKVLAHLTGKGSKDIAICKAVIDPAHKEAYMGLVSKSGNKRKMNAGTQQSIDQSLRSHQIAGTLALQNSQISKKKRRFQSSGSNSSCTSAHSKSPGGLTVDIFQARSKSPSSAAAETEAEKMIQMTLTNESPNPAAESALTFAIADLLHSAGLAFSLANDPKFKQVIKLAKAVPTVSNY